MIKEERKPTKTRTEYSEMVAPYGKLISRILTKESDFQSKNQNGELNISFQRLGLAHELLSAVSYFFAINQIYQSYFGSQNQTVLEKMRKTCYKVMVQLEHVFTNLLDVPFSDYRDHLDAIIDYPELDRYNLIRKAGLTFDLMNDEFGENNRWKWSMVDLNASLATVAKNSLDLRTLQRNTDPRIRYYKERMEFVDLVKRLLQNSADSYRMKYEISTSRPADFRSAIKYLRALRRIYILTNRHNEAVDMKRKIDIWNEKMEQDIRQREKASKLQRLSQFQNKDSEL